MNKTTYREPNVFVFYKDKTNRCSLKENELFFKKDFDLDRYINETYNSSIFNRQLIDKFNYKNYLYKYKKEIISCLALTLFISFNPNKCFALSSMETVKQVGLSTLSLVNDIAIKGVLIYTAIKLGLEYSNGANYHRMLDILKECLGILLAIIVLPKLPGFFNLIF